MYAFVDKGGQPNQMIEQGLSKLEDQFERLMRDKIMRCLPLTDEDRATLYLFVATAHFRTQKIRDHGSANDWEIESRRTSNRSPPNRKLH
jgi:hypothetical protein